MIRRWRDSEIFCFRTTMIVSQPHPKVSQQARTRLGFTGSNPVAHRQPLSAHIISSRPRPSRSSLAERLSELSGGGRRTIDVGCSQKVLRDVHEHDDHQETQHTDHDIHQPSADGPQETTGARRTVAAAFGSVTTFRGPSHLSAGSGRWRSAPTQEMISNNARRPRDSHPQPKDPANGLRATATSLAAAAPAVCRAAERAVVSEPTQSDHRSKRGAPSPSPQDRSGAWRAGLGRHGSATHPAFRKGPRKALSSFP